MSNQTSRARPIHSEDPGSSAADRRLDLPTFLDVLAGSEPAAPGETFLIESAVGGLPLPVQILDTHPAGTTGAPIVFVFHGALDQSRRTIPAFAGRFLSRKAGRFATVIGLADPALGIDPALKLTWFAACARCDTPSAIEALVAGAVSRLRPGRVVFTGGSAGAHAALRHAHALPGSVAVVVNPRMRIRPSRYWQDYVRLCWPGAEKSAPDLRVRYWLDYFRWHRTKRNAPDLRGLVPDIAEIAVAPAGGNTIVYLLNALDEISLRLAADFLAPRATLDDVFLQVEHWPGFEGHSYPLPVWAKWVRAAAEASGISVADLAAQKAANAAPQAAAPRRPAARQNGFDAADLRLADRLAAIVE